MFQFPLSCNVVSSNIVEPASLLFCHPLLQCPQSFSPPIGFNLQWKCNIMQANSQYCPTERIRAVKVCRLPLPPVWRESGGWNLTGTVYAWNYYHYMLTGVCQRAFWLLEKREGNKYKWTITLRGKPVLTCGERNWCYATCIYIIFPIGPQHAWVLTPKRVLYVWWCWWCRSLKFECQHVHSPTTRHMHVWPHLSMLTVKPCCGLLKCNRVSFPDIFSSNVFKNGSLANLGVRGDCGRS